jgi:hypothetical protein
MRAALALALALLCSCRENQAERPGAERRAEKAVATAPKPPAPAEKHELLSDLGACEIEHRGELIDLGTPGVQMRRAFKLAPTPEGGFVDRGGATFERVTAARYALDVWVDEPIEKPSVALRLHGGAARMVHVTIDGHRLGAMRLPADETKTLATTGNAEALQPGRHRIELRFTGVPRNAKTTYAELDWLRLGERDAELETYAAPTYEDVVSDVVLDRVPKKSLVLRPPSNVRCWLRPARDARLRLGVGLWGSGRGVAEIRVHTDGEAPSQLVTKKISGGDNAVWTSLNLDLSPYASKIIGLEFRALEATRGGRIAFGDPVIARKDEAPVVAPRARVAVLVVLASTERQSLPPFSPTRRLAAVASLVRESVAFAAHRAPTTVPAGSLATLLTGLSPRAHRLDDTGARLAPELRTLGEIVKEANGRSAFFTGVPTSFAPFGFNQGFDAFEVVSPVRDLPATEPFARAERWLSQQLDETQESPILLVIHARGSHPPWDLSKDETSQLKPSDYSGGLDPRHGGIFLGQLRARRLRAGKRLLEDDWTRLSALTEAALAKQDAAISRVISLLRDKHAWDETLFLVTSDVAPGAPPDLPFDPKGPLTEDRLLVPLLMKLPGKALAGREIQDPTSAEDVPVTILRALSLNVPKRLDGEDLTLRASARDPLIASAQIAALPDRYVARMGSRLLRASPSNVPTLCALDVDPACASDIFNTELNAARALWHETFYAEQAARTVAPPDASRFPVELDDETSSALIVWGDRQ